MEKRVLRKQKMLNLEKKVEELTNAKSQPQNQGKAHQTQETNRPPDAEENLRALEIYHQQRKIEEENRKAKIDNIIIDVKAPS